MKRIVPLFLALVMALSLAACGSQPNNDNTVDLTAQEVLDRLKAALGDSYTCSVTDEESWLSDYYGLDLTYLNSGVSETALIPSIDPSTAVVLRVKDGYAKDAAALLQERFEQVLSYSELYNTNMAQVRQARLFVNGNYVALLILGQTPDGDVSAEEELQLAQDEAAKVDAAWKDIFGSADNEIVLP